ncbi:SDR family oxidoreductase [Vibrio sp. 10N.261.55.A7]|uniref:UDP-glucose 4-epimerase family protein n=1 Tax=Vibrio sp. 10N.261.55.A7 TaxID=1880851 RepID=UPI000C82A60B|nr:SDR family oxidoreductase [Vibrio sp. 10N.261.55.A7]PMK05020.1 UDP-glucose 4-epimerase [Vibrio sp. 10N.261.55.A7]
MRILITGSGGFLGASLVPEIPEKYNLVFVDRNESNISKSERFSFYQENIHSTSDYTESLKGVECIIHCAARVHVMNDGSNSPLNDYREVNTAGTLNLAKQAVESGVKRFIFISSIKVNGELSKPGKPFRYDDPRAPKDCYGQSKSEAEEQLLDLAIKTGLEVVIIRPTLVYGVGVKANFASLMKFVSRGFPTPFGCLTHNARSLVSVRNLVDLIITCIEHTNAVNQVFLVSDDHDISTSEMVKKMSEALGKSSCHFLVPLWSLKLVGKLLKKEDVIRRLTGSLQVDINHTKKTLDWEPPQTLKDGFKETASYILALQGKNK